VLCSNECFVHCYSWNISICNRRSTLLLKALQVHISDDVEMHVNDFMTQHLVSKVNADNRYSKRHNGINATRCHCSIWWLKSLIDTRQNIIENIIERRYYWTISLEREISFVSFYHAKRFALIFREAQSSYHWPLPRDKHTVWLMANRSKFHFSIKTLRCCCWRYKNVKYCENRKYIKC